MKTQNFTFYCARRKLSGILMSPDTGTAPVVVLCHGFGSYDDDIGGFSRLANFLAAAGIGTLRFSFSGSDPYPDKGTIRPASEWVYDTLASVTALQARNGIDAARIGLLGISVGGGVAIQAAALCSHVRCVVTLAPVADGRAWLQGRWIKARGEEAWNRFVALVDHDARQVSRGEASAVLSHFDIQAMPDDAAWSAVLQSYPRLLSHLTLDSVVDTFYLQATNFVCDIAPRPLLIIQGDSDESVALEQTWELFERAKKIKSMEILHGASHSLWGSPYEEEVFRLVTDWFIRFL